MSDDRGLTTEMESEVGKRVVEPFLLAELLFDTDPLRAWSGISLLDWDSKSWLGTGQLGKVSPIKETKGNEARGLKFQISGVPQENIAMAVNEEYQGRIATLWMGFFNDSGGIIPNPVVLFKGRMDIMTVKEHGGPEGSSMITVSAESRLIDLDRPRELIYDDAQQKEMFPGDRGFEHVVSLQEKEIPWGVGVGSMNAPRVIRPSRPVRPPGGGGPGPGGPGTGGPGGGVGGPGSASGAGTGASGGTAV